MAFDVQRRRFTVAEYHRMAEAGILAEDDRVEILDGEIVQMSPIGRLHAACVDTLTYLFSQLLRKRAVVRVAGPARLGEWSEPQPDVALLRWRPDFYASEDASSEDVLLLVEVADTSLASDRKVKVPLYAGAGIPEVWIVEVEGRTVTVCRDPTPAGYRTVSIAGRGDQITPSAFPDLSNAIDDFLP